jgi:hypothetical protein
LGPNILLSTLFSNALNVKYKVSYPYKATAVLDRILKKEIAVLGRDYISVKNAAFLTRRLERVPERPFTSAFFL